MYSLAFLTTLACILSLVLTPLTRDASRRLGLLDHPDQGRKRHSAALPRTGGVALILSYTGAYALLLILPLKGSGIIGGHLGIILKLLPPVILVFLTGLLDDWRDLAPWQKLMGEFAAASWAYAAGVRIVVASGHPAGAWISFLLTVGWLILCSNAFNLIDGIDGLAAGVGLTASLTIFMAGLLRGDFMLGLATAPLAGCLIGFLRYNFNPASIFLGDSGSLLIGFLLGAYGVIWSQKSATLLGLTAPAIALALPLLEVALSIARRFLRNQPIFAGDRGHIHHRLLDRGFTTRRAALLLYGAGGLLAVLSLLQSVLHNRFAGLTILLFGVATWLGIQYLGYAEFHATGRFLSVAFRPTLSAHVQLEILEHALAGAKSIEQCWQLLARAGQSLGYGCINARLGGLPFNTGRDPAAHSAYWQMRLNLADGDYVNITHRNTSSEKPTVLMPFVDLLRRVMTAKLAELDRTGMVPERPPEVYSGPRNSNTTTVTSSNCGAPSVKVATAS